jgi:alkylhydroperoxidase/carboxymuconolactone decarboxylase family protein YurZ
MPADAPVLDTLADINATSIDHSHLMPRELMLARIAALVAVNAPPASYLANAGVAADSGVTEQDVQEVMIAIAPVVGTAKVVSAGGNMMRALGFAIKVAEADLST